MEEEEGGRHGWGGIDRQESSVFQRRYSPVSGRWYRYGEYWLNDEFLLALELI